MPRKLIKISMSQMVGKGLYSPCQAVTKKGKACSRKAIVGSKYCTMHGKMYDVIVAEDDIPG